MQVEHRRTPYALWHDRGIRTLLRPKRTESLSGSPATRRRRTAQCQRSRYDTSVIAHGNHLISIEVLTRAIDPTVRIFESATYTIASNDLEPGAWIY